MFFNFTSNHIQSSVKKPPPAKAICVYLCSYLCKSVPYRMRDDASGDYIVASYQDETAQFFGLVE